MIPDQDPERRNLGELYSVYPSKIPSAKQTSQLEFQQRLFIFFQLHPQHFLSTFLAFPRYFSFPSFTCSQSYPLLPSTSSQHLCSPLSPSLADVLSVTTGKVLCNPQCRACLGTGNWLVNYRTTPLQFVRVLNIRISVKQHEEHCQQRTPRNFSHLHWEIYLFTLQFGQNDPSPLHPKRKCELEKASVQDNVILSAIKKKENK